LGTQTNDTDKSLAQAEATENQTQLTVQPSVSAETVVITNAVLLEPGYLVVREGIGGTAGQIVEISPYLDAGTYSNIEIPLGEFYTGENELMVLVYTDAEGDKVLNDLDQPFVDASGNFVARFVATGDVVANNVIEAKPAGIPLADMGMNAQTITYTNEGFVPATIEVGAGAMIHFVNESDTEMWVASDNHPAHTDLPTFDQFKPGDMFMYVFEEPGTWEYHDHLQPSFGGSVTVTSATDTGESASQPPLSRNTNGYFSVGSDSFAALTTDDEVTTINVHIPYGGEIADTEALVPYNETAQLLAALPEDKSAPVAVYCRSGSMSAIAAKTLADAGYTNVYDLTGGMNAYQASGRPLITKDQSN